MSRKYISQREDTNFIYPNNDRSQYDVEIIHNINDNYMTGCTASINSYTATTSNITFNSRYSMNYNNAEKFIDEQGFLHVFSVHMLAPGQDYYKPWRCIYVDRNAVTGNQIYTGTSTSFSISATNMGLPSNGFIAGTYYLEFRFIGKKVVIPVCVSVNVVPSATPTPTPTTTGPTATPPPTPSPTPTGTSSAKNLQIYGRDIDGTPSTLTLFYSVNGGGNINVPGATATTLPGSCSFIYTITGLTTNDSIEFGTSILCVMNGNGSSASCPSSSGSATTFTYVIDAPTTQQVALTVDSGTIP